MTALNVTAEGAMAALYERDAETGARLVPTFGPGRDLVEAFCAATGARPTGRDKGTVATHPSGWELRCFWGTGNPQAVHLGFTWWTLAPVPGRKAGPCPVPGFLAWKATPAEVAEARALRAKFG